MPIALPQFKRREILQLTVCCRLDLDPAKPIKLPKENRVMIAEAKDGSNRMFIRLASGPDGHLHADIARREYFKSNKFPTTTHDWDQVKTEWNRFIGQNALVRGSGLYRLQTTRLPEGGIIRFMSVESSSSAVSMKLTGATLAVTGAPIQKLNWKFREKGTKVDVELEFRDTKSISDLYLQDAEARVNEAFELFICKK
jgi:hypothetical protein